ncbi:FAD-dependent monooxygenase [Reyranella sp.]|uniref:FAD-dependent monooxygenase n=1 Tax=Reyranella sp. TaxID=1929291 RepID=UPI001223ED37|nr:FAD-dependent monooxygenase [Reyranella sp.]TAJ90494.1 MAG: monooxygenase [Reyranella sp.]
MVDVLVVGAGPVGLTMAAELARHGVRCRIVDRLEKPSPYCRAIGVTPRTLEVWDDMGIAREMIDAGLWIEGLRSIIHGHPPNDAHQDLSDLPYSQLGLPQYETERLLARHLGRFGITVERGTGLHSLQQDEKGISARLERLDGGTENATFRYVIGCDGAHSTVRHALGIAFEGEAMPMTFMLGDVHVAWDLPRGMALRALRLVDNAAPDMFVAIPLPEPGRYRVSMIAPSELAQSGGSDHGIQSEARGPGLGDIQAVADSLIPDKPRLSDLRWSSMFRISMRLAAQYRRGRAFLAGDAAHIHPPTGGQGMNTGIQDAYNLAWKLALVLGGAASEKLLDSYEAERRPVGADVVARTRAANESHGRDAKPDRLADTQVRISYNGTAWIQDDAGPVDAGPVAGDRAPDSTGLRRQGVGFPVRLFDVLRGTEHVLLVHLGREEAPDLAAFTRKISSRSRIPLRIVGIVQEEGVNEQAGIALYRDVENSVAHTYGSVAAAFLIRPDGYIGWRGKSYRDAGLVTYLDRISG